jgi:hypothetical protein
MLLSAAFIMAHSSLITPVPVEELRPQLRMDLLARVGEVIGRHIQGNSIEGPQSGWKAHGSFRPFLGV